MEIEYGAEVIDKKGKVLGTVDYVIRNTWTGEISKFVVRRELPNRELLFSLEDVLEAANQKIKVSISLDELNGNT